MTTPPTVLVMDLGGVTCRWLPDRRLAALSALSGLPPATIDHQVFESGFDDAGERGRVALDEFTRTLASMLGLETGSPTDRALRHAWGQAFEPDPEVLRVIGEARARRALFTNNGPLLEAAMAASDDLAPVREAFDELVFSWHLGITKPEPEAFARAAERLGAAGGELVLVDDSEANVAAAAHAGWHAHRFTTVADLRTALADL
ncbi:MAG: HAD-IA family hydrolase, partial [Acidimicrobiales bacterium]|nr:HAD-IA family hydrolase [Acidimicrobiales bacterium]